MVKADGRQAYSLISHPVTGRFGSSLPGNTDFSCRPFV